MPIQIKVFASLAEQLNTQQAELQAGQASTVQEVWQHIAPDTPIPENVLMAVNMEYVSPDSPVSDGDEVAFFPPVTGG